MSRGYDTFKGVLPMLIIRYAHCKTPSGFRPFLCIVTGRHDHMPYPGIHDILAFTRDGLSRNIASFSSSNDANFL